MSDVLRVAAAQVNVTVGDLDGNTQKIIDYIRRAKEEDVDMVCFPELAITGYPPRDLLLKPSFIEANRRHLEAIVEKASEMIVVVGFADGSGDDVYNAAAVIHDGKLLGVQRKFYLPNYGVFDEYRYFQMGMETLIFEIDSIAFGVNICEDIWYPGDPTRIQALAGARVIANISSSPYHAGKPSFRRNMLSTRASDNVAAIVYTNLVGGQDELIFDGRSMIFDHAGRLIAQGALFEEDFVVADINLRDIARARLTDIRHREEALRIKWEDQKLRRIVSLGSIRPKGKRDAKCSVPLGENPFLPKEEHLSYDPCEEIYSALKLGLRDYVRKNGFKKVVVGLSGGIDSSLVATIAADALGPENVVGVSMPSRISSQGSKDDARALAENLGIEYKTLSIQKIFDAYLETLRDEFAGRPWDIAEENIQARIRGALLMALSNKFGYLVLTTGNKSEVSVGYATLYGDMAGGLAVLSDVPKTLVYKLAEYRNRLAGWDIIPHNCLVKPPSAELRENQKDTDSLPEYPLLDGILNAYVEQDMSAREIVALGYDPETVLDVIRKVDRNEYKRRQAAPGLKITPKAFGLDRRLPITNKYTEPLESPGSE
ncbi:MAG: NAD+ synthase [bacterium]